MSGIVERLRRVAGVVCRSDDDFAEDYTLGRDAADEIERLRAALKGTIEELEYMELWQLSVQLRRALEGKDD